MLTQNISQTSKKVIQYKKSSQQGRSLAEMLGVLAMMGVLAVVGVLMYNTILDKLHANTIVNEAQKRATVITTQITLQGRTDPSLAEFKENTFAGGTFSTNVFINGLYRQFGIQVSNVNKAVCQNILTNIGESTSIRRLAAIETPTKAMTDCDDNNTFLMIYNNDMASSNKDIGYATEGCTCHTVCGQCVIENGVSRCVNECPNDVVNCQQNSDCSGECVACIKEGGQATGTCRSCERVEYLLTDGNQWIDTGVTGEARWIGSAQSTSTKTSSQCLVSAGSQTGRFLASQIMNTLFWGVSGTTPGAYSSVAPTQKADFDVIFLNTITTATINEQRISVTPAGTLSSWRLFQVNGTNKFPFYGKLFHLNVYQGETMVRSFVPVRDPQGTPALYDKVEKRFYYNGGTGSFQTN